MFHLVSQAALGSWVLCLIFRVLFLNLENTYIFFIEFEKN